MSRGQRPQLVPPRGLRVVLIAQRSAPDQATKAALADLERIGWLLISIVAPEEYPAALRMVLDGLVDRVVPLRPEYFPYVISAPDLKALASYSNSTRTRMLPRLGNEQSSRTRRPQPIEQAALTTNDGSDPEPEFGTPESNSRHAEADSAERPAAARRTWVRDRRRQRSA